MWFNCKFDVTALASSIVTNESTAFGRYPNAGRPENPLS